MVSRVIARISQRRVKKQNKKTSHRYTYGSSYMIYKAETGHK